MKTATIPPLRVEPQLRKDVERLLEPGETISTFVERAVRDSVDRRLADAEFGARALASRAESKKTGRYHSAASVLRELKVQTRAARKNHGKRR
ncbi:MAG: YlcI/YnfO family protein [Archangium sp.]|nr:YlcI/YnfO family protein [Archangium sp.]MDP3154540.1 YlcI/YnfO family protein [Archangium sp.]MDP3569421.1 YlcI/YnfO family protein [Archangium sp.]